MDTRIEDPMHLRALLDDANGKLHKLQWMMHEAGFPMRIKLGEDLHGNEDWARVRPECQLRDLMDALEIARAKAGMTMGRLPLTGPKI